MDKTLSGSLRELSNKGKVQLGNAKRGRGRLRELFITKFKSQFKRSFTKVVETSAHRLRVWSQGELRLYTGKSIKEMIKFTTVIERILLQSFVKTVI